MTQPFVFSYKRAEVPIGVGPGNFLYWALENSILPTYVPPVDFTTVTQVFFTVLRQKDGTTAKWIAGSLTNVTTAGLVAVYGFGTTITSKPYDCYIDGTYLLRPYAVTAGAPTGIPFDEFPLYVMPQ